MNTKSFFRECISLKTKSAQAGFGRADLVAVLALISIFALLKAAGLSVNRAASQSAGCIENLRTLTRAWQQFAVDQQYLPPNPDDGNVTDGFNWAPGQAGRGGSQEFDPDILTDSKRSLLYPYVIEKDASVFRCPADLREGVYQGKDPGRVGTRVFAARSYSMNLAVGSNPYVKPIGTPTDGAWLDNNHNHTRKGKWRTYGRFDDIVEPAPSNLTVLIDEDVDSLNDATFAFGMEREEWIDWPASRHETGAIVSFADGHAELRHWLDPRTVVQNRKVTKLAVPGSVDYQWLHDRISAPKLLNRALIVPRFAGVRAADVKLVWPAQQGVTYRVEFSDDLVTWQLLEATVQVSGGEASTVDPAAATTARKFYRLVPNSL